MSGTVSIYQHCTRRQQYINRKSWSDLSELIPVIANHRTHPENTC